MQRYHIAQFFDGGNSDGFDAKLSIRKKFLSIVSNSISNTGGLSGYLSIFSVKFLNEVHPSIFCLIKKLHYTVKH